MSRHELPSPETQEPGMEPNPSYRLRAHKPTKENLQALIDADGIALDEEAIAQQSALIFQHTSLTDVRDLYLDQYFNDIKAANNSAERAGIVSSYKVIIDLCNADINDSNARLLPELQASHDPTPPNNISEG